MDTGVRIGADHAKATRLEIVHSCPYCGETAHERAASDVEDWFFRNVTDRSDFERCANCSSLWVSARLTSKHLPEAYASYYTHSPVDSTNRKSGLKSWLKACYVQQRFGGKSDPVTVFAAQLYRRLAPGLVHVDALYRFAPPAPARILDYGCGGGTYLRQMRALGYDVVGSDFDPLTLDPLKKDGFTVYPADDIFKQDLSETFDLITINHVIEHVADPVELVWNLVRMLKPGGILYCEAPNAGATGLDVFGRYWRGLEAPRHLNVPSRKGLSILLGGTEMDEGRWIDREWVRSLTWPLSMDAVPPAERPAYEERAAQAPSQTLDNSEYLIVIARKRSST